MTTAYEQRMSSEYAQDWANRNFERIRSEASRLTLQSFDSDTAFNLGCTLRRLAFSDSLNRWPIAISITHVNGDQPLFFVNSSPGVPPDYMQVMDSIRNTVKRWGKSTVYLSIQNPGWQERESDIWKEKYNFTPGGWPVKVRGVEGVVAVIVVYGVLEDPEECHKLIIQALENELQKQRSARA